MSCVSLSRTGLVLERHGGRWLLLTGSADGGWGVVEVSPGSLDALATT